MANFVDMMKSKIAEAKASMTDGSRDDSVRKEIQNHINEMEKLLKEVENKDENAMEAYKEKFTASIDKLNKMLSR